MIKVDSKVAISLAIQSLFAIECLRRSNQQEVATGQNFEVLPLEYIRDVGVCRERTN